MKTPEQLAEEYASFAKQYVAESIRKQQMMANDKIAFLAGYQAAKDETNLPTSAKWISVKERLPVFRQYNQNDESGYTEDVLMCFVWGRIRINNFEKVDGIVTTGYGNNLNEVTHWMPLPEAPKGER